MINLKAIKKRLKAATPRPWLLLDGKETEDHGLWHVYHQSRGRVSSRSFKWDAIFILHAASDIEALVAEVERLRGAIQKHKEGLKDGEGFPWVRDQALWAVLDG